MSPASAQRKRPTVVAAPLKQIARASREGARGESTKRCGQRAAPEHTSGSNRRSCAFKQSATPSVEIAAALAPLNYGPTLAQSCCSSAREDRLRSPSARDRPSLAQRSFGLRPVQPQLSRGKRFCDSTRSSGSARLALAIKSLQPSPELSSGHSDSLPACASLKPGARLSL